MPIVDPWEKTGIVDPWEEEPPRPVATSGFVGGDVPLAEHTPEESRQNARMFAGGAAMAASAPLYAAQPWLTPAIAGAAATAGEKAVDYIWGAEQEPLPWHLAKNTALMYAFAGAGELASATVKPLFTPLEKRITSTIRKAWEKAVRPEVAGRANAPQAEAYMQKAQSAVESIIKNKPNLSFITETGERITGELPKTLAQTAQAVDQTKRMVFRKYDEMMKHSEIAGREINFGGTIKELEAYANNVVNVTAGGGGVARAKTLAENLSTHKITLSEAQDLLAILNARTAAFRKNPTQDGVSTYAADVLASTNIRQALDRAVENLGYQPLRNDYGALRAVEKHIQHRANIFARQSKRGLIDYADFITAAEAVTAVATFNPVHAGRAGAIAAMKRYHKYLVNPNNIIRSMFNQTEKLMSKRVPQQAMKALPPGPRPMGGAVSESYVKGVPAEVQVTGYLGEEIPGAGHYAGIPGEAEARLAAERATAWQSANPEVQSLSREFLGWPYKEPLQSLPPKGGTFRSTGLLGDFDKTKITGYYKGKKRDLLLRKKGY